MKASKYNGVAFTNIWRNKYKGDYVLLGISKRFCTSRLYSWDFTLFGLTLHVYFKKELML
jgi:hypothetical protein